MDQKQTTDSHASGTGTSGSALKFQPKIPSKRNKKEEPTTSFGKPKPLERLGHGARRGGRGGANGPQRNAKAAPVLTASGPFAYGPAMSKASSSFRGGSAGGSSSGGAGTSADSKVSKSLVFLNGSGTADTAADAASSSDDSDIEEGTGKDDYDADWAESADSKQNVKLHLSDPSRPVIVEEEFKHVKRAEARARIEQMKSISQDHKPLSHVIFADPVEDGSAMDTSEDHNQDGKAALMLFQFPLLPSSVETTSSSSTSNRKVEKAKAPNPFAAGGKIGRLLMYKSGKMRLILNEEGLSFDVRQGTHFADCQKVISVQHPPPPPPALSDQKDGDTCMNDTKVDAGNQEPTRAFILGDLTKKFIVSPDIDRW